MRINSILQKILSSVKSLKICWMKKIIYLSYGLNSLTPLNYVIKHNEKTTCTEGNSR